MNDLLTNRIRKDFPNLVWDNVSAVCGIECGTGWGSLAYAFLADASALCRQEESQLVIQAIGNKFGTLRLECHPRENGVPTEPAGIDDEADPRAYLVSMREHPASARLRALMHRYEKTSVLICELCGAPGQIEHPWAAWTQPLCSEHCALTLRTSQTRSPDQHRLIDDETASDILSRIDRLSMHPATADLFSHFFEAHL